ncbi:MAG: diacylglycerol/lipid kinase family protein, partial [Candidatus Limnocylindrus sp.]
PAEVAAREAALAGVSRVIVLGGDGSASQAANGIYAAGGLDALAAVELCLLPAGTGRDFARSAGIARDPVAAARALARGAAARRVDVGTVRCGDGPERLFLNVASFGVSARIAHALEEFPQLKRRAGSVAFGLATVRAGLRYAADAVALTVDGTPFGRGPTAAVAIANGGWFGGGMHVAPDANITDGTLSVVRFGDLARSDFVLSLPRLYRGTHYTHPKVTHTVGSRVAAASIGDVSARPIEIEADGEIAGALPATFGVLSGALALR